MQLQPPSSLVLRATYERLATHFDNSTKNFFSETKMRNKKHLYDKFTVETDIDLKTTGH